MITKNELKAIAERVGVDCKSLPNNLKTTICRAILTKLGYDCSCLPNNLTTTMLKEIGNLLEGGAGGGSSNGGVVVVDELPTENIQEGVIYQVNEVCDIDVYLKNEVGHINLKSAIVSLGITPNIIYEVVDSLPESPNISDLQTFNPTYVYIYNDTPYLYGNAGYGDMWIDVITLIASVTGLTYENKGYVSNANEMFEGGLYVTYKKGKQGILATEGYDIIVKESGWNDYEKIFDRTIETFSNEKILIIPQFAFVDCEKLKKVYIPNAKVIGEHAFDYNLNLEEIDIPNVIRIAGHAFSYCEKLRKLIIRQTECVCDIFNNISEGSGLEAIYVPDELVEDYKTHTTWSKYYADIIKPLSEYVEE